MISEFVWIAIFLVGFVWEMIGVFTERRTGIEPLTHIVRDRLMRRERWMWYAVLAFWTWLGIHFFIQGAP